MTGAAETGHAALIRDLVLQAGAAGTTSAELSERTGIPTSRMAGKLNAMVMRGEVQARPHKGWRMYWAAGVAITPHAEAVLRARIDTRLNARSIVAARVKHQGRAANVLVTPPPAHAAPVRVKDHGRVRPEGPADDSRAVRIVAPTCPFTARHQFIQLEPDNRRPPFASIPLGATLSPDHLQEVA